MSILVSLIKDIFSRQPSAEQLSAVKEWDLALLEQGKLDELAAASRKEVVKTPHSVDALMRLASALDQDSDEAYECYRKIVSLDSKHFSAKLWSWNHMQGRCDWRYTNAGLVRELRKLVHKPITSSRDRLSPLTFLTMPGTTAEEQKLCAQRYARYEARDMVAMRKKLNFQHERKGGAKRKISVGYLSGDLHQHAVPSLMAQVFELHDRSRFHITAYSYGPDDGSAMRKRMKKAFDRFVDIRDDSYAESARKINSDQVDILVDLKGYTERSRSSILALRPAPIQVNYLGYPGTMGADYVDYLIADRFIIPPDYTRHYTENVVWLPDCYMPNDTSRPRLAAPSRSECGLPDDHVVFCSFNNAKKIGTGVFDVWCRLLKAVPKSTLWISGNSQIVGNLKREAEQRGVNSERLVAAKYVASPDQHLARIQCADLFLDTISYNAHTTCSDALWMGLPVVTCAGQTFPSRVAGSLLATIGAPELVTSNLNEYYQLALDLATNKDKLAAIRNKLLINRDTSPLFDSTRFTRNLEGIYAKMMADHVENKR